AVDPQTITTTILADPEGSALEGSVTAIPARIVGVEVDGSAQVETSGNTDVPAIKARGVAAFTNLIPDQVTIPAGTIVRTSAAQPVRFVTLEDTTLPGDINATVAIPIEAIEPGFEGNLPSNRINQVEGPLSPRIGVTNPEPSRGGDVASVPAVSQDDQDRVRALVLQNLQQRAFAEMQTDPFIALLDSEFIPIDSLAVVLVQTEDYSGFVGQEADTLSLNMRVVVQGVAINEVTAREVVYLQLADQVGSGFQIDPETLVFRRGETVEIDDQRRVTFVMQGAGEVTPIIDASEVRRLLRGLPPNEALATLDRVLPLAAPPQIETWPRFWPLMPLVPARIQIETGSNQ
ncbi:MAG: hypothetical protein GYB68_00345, partial [Chloroflexi bacterium]|nr:hypothetical protein [Chloroflexota bacterium]